jgi:hypothetical protein
LSHGGHEILKDGAEQKDKNEQEKVNERGAIGTGHPGNEQSRAAANEERIGAYQKALSAAGAKSTDELK